MGIVLLRRRVLRSCLGTKEILREGEMWRTDAQIDSCPIFLFHFWKWEGSEEI